MSLDEYKYIVSRRRHSFSDEEWEALEPELAARLPEIRSRVASFGRARDCEDEDGRKELLKYLLGVRGDLPYDCGAAPLGALCMRRSRVEATDRHMLALIYDVYSRLEDYKQQRYGAVLAGSEAELRRRYVSAANGNGVEPDGLVKIKWDLYNIHADRFILLSAAALVSAVSLGFGGVWELSRERLEAIAAHASAAFGGLFRSLGIRSAAAMRRELQKALAALGARDYSAYLAVEDAHGQPALARYRTESAAGLLERIEQLSAAATVSPAEDRQRSAQLVNLLKSYYMRACAENGTLRCECCGEEAFITAAGEPYVEFHHLIPFGIAYGPDHYLNLFALCPTATAGSTSRPRRTSTGSTPRPAAGTTCAAALPSACAPCARRTCCAPIIWSSCWRTAPSRPWNTTASLREVYHFGTEGHTPSNIQRPRGRDAARIPRRQRGPGRDQPAL